MQRAPESDTTLLDALSNRLVVHVLDRQRFTSFRYAIEGVWAGPEQQNGIDIPHSNWRVNEIFLPYRDPGAATTRLLAERYRTLRRDPVNFPEAAASLVLLATAAEAREHFEVVRRALLAVRWPPTWMLPVEVCGPVIARRHGFLDELVERDLTEAEANGLCQVFLDLATEFDPAAGQSVSGREPGSRGNPHRSGTLLRAVVPGIMGRPVRAALWRCRVGSGRDSVPLI